MEDAGDADRLGLVFRSAKIAWIGGAIVVAGAIIAASMESSALISAGSAVAVVGDDRPNAPSSFATPSAKVADASLKSANSSSNFKVSALEVTPSAPVDRELQSGERHAVELNEMICAQTGQNCEFAKMARRQYEERYGDL